MKLATLIPIVRKIIAYLFNTYLFRQIYDDTGTNLQIDSRMILQRLAYVK